MNSRTTPLRTAITYTSHKHLHWMNAWCSRVDMTHIFSPYNRFYEVQIPVALKIVLGR